MSEIEYRHSAEQNSYLAEVDGVEVGRIDYRITGDVVDVQHTETDPARQGQGIAAALTEFAVRDIQRSGRKLTPSCPYAAAWLGRHPEFADLVAG